MLIGLLYLAIITKQASGDTKVYSFGPTKLTVNDLEGKETTYEKGSGDIWIYERAEEGKCDFEVIIKQN